MDNLDPKKATVSLGGGSVVAFAAGWLTPSVIWKAVLWTLCAILVLGLVALLILLYLKRRKQAQEDGKVDKTLRQLAAKQAEEMKEAFLEGLKQLKSSGVQLRDLPWYLIIGEPSAGKTVACRALLDLIKVPAEMNNDLQGKEGTYNMDWWFYEDAVVIDIAGRVVFQDTPEFAQLLDCVAQARGDCPINGIFVTIPSDSLLTDSEEKIDDNAARLRKQLEAVKKHLDIRFPIYVVVTKSDFIPGFREYFSSFAKVQARSQILGWSNPANLEAEFDAKATESSLAGLVEALKVRRLPLLVPGPQGPGQPFPSLPLQGAEDLFTFPHALRDRLPNLGRYLDKMFGSAKEDSKSRYSKRKVKRPFFRGIYFTSSKQEGSVLNVDLARELGVPVEQVENPVEVKFQRAYFWQDLMVEKVFPEAGLVTPASDMRKARRRDQLILVGAGAAALVLLGSFYAFGWSKLNKSVGGDLEDWQAATNAYASLQALPLPLRFQTNSIKTSSGTYNLAAFHSHLRQRVGPPLPVPWIYGFLRIHLDNERRKAQFRLFEDQIVVPLVEQTRLAVVNGLPADGGSTIKSLGPVLISLLQLEADLMDKRSSASNAVSLVTNCWRMLAGGAGPLDTNLLETLKWTYFQNPVRDDMRQGSRAPVWPPPVGKGTALDQNTAISRGLDLFISLAKENNKRIDERLQELGGFRTDLYEFSQQEGALADKVGEPQATDEQISGHITGMRDAAAKIAAAMDRQPLLTNRLAGCYDKLKAEAASTSGNVLSNMQTRIPNRPDLLFVESRDRLTNAVNSLSSGIEESKAKAPGNVERLDAELLSCPEPKRLAYSSRLEAYQKAWSYRDEQPFMVGNRWVKYHAFQTNLNAEAASEDDLGFSRFKPTRRALLSRSLSEVRAKFQENFAVPAQTLLDNTRKSFDVADPLKIIQSLRAAGGTFGRLREDRRAVADFEKTPAFDQTPFLSDPQQAQLRELATNCDHLETYAITRLNTLDFEATGNLRFPLAKYKANAGAESPAGVKSVFEGLRALEEALDLNSPPLNRFTNELADLKNSISYRRKMAQQLCDEKLTCTVKIVKVPGAYNALRVNAGKWRYRQANTPEMLKASDALTVELSESSNDLKTDAKLSLGPWSVVQLLDQAGLSASGGKPMRLSVIVHAAGNGQPAGELEMELSPSVSIPRPGAAASAP